MRGEKIPKRGQGGDDTDGFLRSWITSHLTWLRFPTISITPTDILEIIILAFLVYKLLVWIKDSRAWTLLKGILTIVICVGIVYILQMDTLIYIVNHALTIVITAAVVVFQPELRKVLSSWERSVLYLASCLWTTCAPCRNFSVTRPSTNW